MQLSWHEPSPPSWGVRHCLPRRLAPACARATYALHAGRYTATLLPTPLHRLAARTMQRCMLQLVLAVL